MLIPVEGMFVYNLPYNITKQHNYFDWFEVTYNDEF